MRKGFRFIFVGLLTLSVLTFGYWKLPVFNKTTVTSEALIVSVDKNQLVNEATAIVSGKVISSEVQNDFAGFPVTDYRIKVNKIFKGTPAAEFEVRAYEGENEKVKYVPDEEMVTFQVGEEVVLFLTDEKGTREDKNDFDYFVVGQSQGKFKKEKGQIKNEKFSFDETTFEQDLEKIEKENKAKGLKKFKAGPNDDI